jgi:TP901 family phage tail tape measure protein
LSDEKFKISITIDPGDSLGTAKRIEGALTKVAVATGDADGAIHRLQGSLDRSIRKMSAAETKTRDLAKANKAVATSADDAKRAINGWSQSLAKTTELGVKGTQKNIYDSYLAQQKQYNADRNAAYAEEARRNAASIAQTRGVYKTLMDQQRAYNADRNAAYAEQARREREQAKSLLGDLRSAGYEMIVVGAIFTRFGTNIIQSVGNVVGAAIDYERAFANVIRTTSDGSISVAALRQELIDLTSTLPVTFDELAKIATLGGQLGIAGSGIDEFTSVVARLTATTDLTADAAGTALGRFQALLGVPSEDFEKLASAILKVGVNSVATETQIVAISTQISSMADFAGYTAEQVVGLAGALASVGAAPELSRGTITRTFALISKAVAAGGSDLDEFARISGVSSEKFTAAFGTDKFSSIFRSFLANLGRMKDNGDNVVQVLNDLGISSVRDVPLLLRLSNATATVAKTAADASSAYLSGTELQKQYSIIAGTTAARIQILTNNITNLLATLGGSATGPLSDFVDQLSEAAKTLTDIFSTPIGQGFALFGLILTGIIGVLAVLLGSFAFAAGTFLLLSNALDKLSLSGAVSSATMDVLNGSMLGAGRAATVLAVAIKSIPFVAAAAGIELALSALTSVAKEAYGFDSINTSFATLIGSSDKLIQRIEQSGNVFAGFVNAGDSLPGTVDEFRLAVLAVDDQLATMVSNGYAEDAIRRIQSLMVTTGKSFDEVLTALPDTQKALEGTAEAAGTTSTEFLKTVEAESDFSALQASTASAIGLTVEEFDSLNDSLNNARDSFFSLSTIVQNATHDTVLSLKEVNDALANQLIASANWEKNVGILIGRGLDAGVVKQLADAGIEGQQLAQALVDNVNGEFDRFAELAPQAWGTGVEGITNTLLNNASLLQAASDISDEALNAMITALGQGDQAIVDTMAKYGIVLANNPLKLRVTTEEARNEVNQFLNRVAASGATVGVGIRAGGSGGASRGYVDRYAAAGGYIAGPGSGTSDSIPARLSNGEYVIRAASVQRYGTGLFDQLNRGVAKFARGGPVGGSSAPSSIGMGITELGPKSLSVMRDAVRQEMGLYLDPMGVARLANKGNRQLASQGAR